MSQASLTRKAYFAAAHRYFRPEWTAEENQRVFGACANPHGHGHNYMIEVTVVSDIDPLTGFSADLPALDGVIAEQITGRLDHQHLNHVVPEFREGGLIPTSENIAAWCWRQLSGALPGTMKLQRVRVHEDQTFYVDFQG